jgi:uncharacterized protein YjbI with pentapeptide repeats
MAKKLTRSARSWVDRMLRIATKNRGAEPDRLRFCLELLSRGATEWNAYRAEHPDFKPYLRHVYLGDEIAHPDLNAVDFSDGDLVGLDMTGQPATAVNFSRACLGRATFVESNLEQAVFDEADLRGADLSQAYINFGSFNGAKMQHVDLDEIDMECASIQGADLSYSSFSYARAGELHAQDADLSYARLMHSDFNHAEFIGTDLTCAMLIGNDFSFATFEGARVFGSSAWGLNMEGANQSRLLVSEKTSAPIWVDDLEIAQFVHLLLDHKKLRNAINAVTLRGVLLLGLIFDFERPEGRNYTETVKILAGLSRFVIVDLSGPSVPQELYATVPHLKIPFVPIIETSRKSYAMVGDILEYPWVIKPVFAYDDLEHLERDFETAIVEPAERQHKQRAAASAAIL